MTESDARGLEDSPNDGKQSIDTEARSNPVGTDAIGPDDLFQALANERRRQVIRAIDDGPRDMGAIARAIAAAENEIDVEDVDAQQRKRVYISLHQVHLEQLDDWDIIEWDTVGQTVAPGPAHETALDVMERVADDEPDTEPSLLGRVVDGIRGVVA